MIKQCAIAFAIAAVMSGLAYGQDCSSLEQQAEPIRQALANSDTHSAVNEAEALVGDFSKCAESYLVLASALNVRLDEVGGMRALSVSRRYRKAIRTALRLEPNNIDARTEEIGYLIYAPGIAGGSKKRAAKRIQDLRSISALAASQMNLALARTQNDETALLDALEEAVALAPQNHDLRSERVRRLILSGRYDAAIPELAVWSSLSPEDEWVLLEQIYLTAATYVYAGTEFGTAELLLGDFVTRRPFVDHARLASVAQANALRGDAMVGQRRFDEARSAYRSALDDEPENVRAREGIERLKGR